jgi:hypothetical protein
LRLGKTLGQKHFEAWRAAAKMHRQYTFGIKPTMQNNCEYAENLLS